MQVGRQSFLLVRGDDGAIRAFHNICRHRGHELLEVGEHRHQRGIKCPYHAWVYGLEGDLRATPRFNLEVPKDRFPLVGSRLERWHGWLFLNASGDAQPFDEWIGNASIAVDGYDCERLVRGATHAYEIAANWKIIVENYNECYHCSEIHPELCKVTPPDSDLAYPERSDGMWFGGPMELLDHAVTMSLTGESLGVPIPGLPEPLLRRVGLRHADAEPADQPAPGLRDDAPPRAPRRPGGRGSSARGTSRPRRSIIRGSAPTTRASSGTSRTARTGARARASSATSPRPGYRPGPFSYWESAVFVGQEVVARGYLEGRLTPPDHSFIDGVGRGLAGF